MQPLPEHHIHSTTHVLAALLKAAVEHCVHVWIAEHALLLGSNASVPAAYVLNGHVPTGDLAHPFQHYTAAISVKVDLHDVQLVSALLILYDRVGRLPPISCDRQDIVTIDDLRVVLTKERVLDALIPVSQFRAFKAAQRANNEANPLLAEATKQLASINAA